MRTKNDGLRATADGGQTSEYVLSSTYAYKISRFQHIMHPSHNFPSRTTMMFVRAAALLALLVAATPESASAYVVSPSNLAAYHAATSASPKSVASGAAFAARPFGGGAASTSIRRRRSGSTVLSLASSNGEDGLSIVSSEDGHISRRKRAMAKARTFGQLMKQRMDTMDAAFGQDTDVEVISADGNRPSSGGGDAKGLVPMQAGVVKTGIQIAVAVWLFKKIKKMVGGKGKSAEDDGVTRTKEEDDALHAWTCNNCGATLFVARGKEFRYFRKDHKCYVCGNTGRENFTNTRGDIIERTGDDFEGTQYWESLPKKEQRKWMKEAFGDETIAMKMAIDQWRKDNGIEVEPAPAEVVAQVEKAVGGSGGEEDSLLDEVADEAGEEEAAAAPTEEATAASSGEESGPAPTPAPAVSAPVPTPAPKPKPVPKPAAPAFDDDDIFDQLDDL